MQITIKAGATATAAAKRVPLGLPILVVSDSRIILLVALVSPRVLQREGSSARRLQHQPHLAVIRTVGLAPLILAAASSGRSLAASLGRLLLLGPLLGSSVRLTIPLVVLGREALVEASARAVEGCLDKTIINSNSQSLSLSVPRLPLLVEDLAQVVLVLAAQITTRILVEVFSGLAPRRIATPSVSKTMLRPTHNRRIPLVGLGSKTKIKIRAVIPIPLEGLGSRTARSRSPADSSEIHQQQPTQVAACLETRTTLNLVVGYLAKRTTTSPLAAHFLDKSQLWEEVSLDRRTQILLTLVEDYSEALEITTPIKISLSKIKEVVCLATITIPISRSLAVSLVVQLPILAVDFLATRQIITTSSLAGASLV